MKSNILTKLTMGTISTFIVSGMAMADVPYGFDNYTVTAGIITDNGADPDAGGPLDNCSVGFTCERMAADGQGIMQRTVTDTGTGVAYLQLVITEPGATGAANTLTFSTESFVFAAGINSNNIGLQQRIGGSIDNLTQITEGAFETGGDESDPASTSGDGITLRLSQTVDLGGSDFQEFTQVGQNGSALQAVNQRVSGQGTDARFTVRKALGGMAPTTAGTLGAATFENEGSGLIEGVSYSAGDNLQVVWIGADQPGDPAQQFGLQDYTNLTTGGVASRTGETGMHGEFTDNGPWEWDPVFGNAPAAPPATPEFP